MSELQVIVLTLSCNIKCNCFSTTFSLTYFNHMTSDNGLHSNYPRKQNNYIQHNKAKTKITTKVKIKEMSKGMEMVYLFFSLQKYYSKCFSSCYRKKNGLCSLINLGNVGLEPN